MPANNSLTTYSDTSYINGGERIQFVAAWLGHRDYLRQAGNTESAMQTNIRNSLAAHGTVHDIYVRSLSGHITGLTRYAVSVDWTPDAAGTAVQVATIGEWVLLGANWVLHGLGGGTPPSLAWLTHPDDWCFNGANANTLAVVDVNSIRVVPDGGTAPLLPSPPLAPNAVAHALGTLSTVHDPNSPDMDGHLLVTDDLASWQGISGATAKLEVLAIAVVAVVIAVKILL